MMKASATVVNTDAKIWVMDRAVNTAGEGIR